MATTNNRDDHKSSETSNGSSLPTRTIYTAVISVVIANIIAGLTLLVRNPMDEIDELQSDFKQHLRECDDRLDKIESDHVLFDYQINQHNFKIGVRPNKDRSQ